METRIHKVAAQSNVATYDSDAAKRYVDGAPHVKHDSLRELYGRLVCEIYDYAASDNHRPRVLDLGAGDGAATLPLLGLGAMVTAVDISRPQITALQAKCVVFGDALDVLCGDVYDAIVALNDRQYDIVVVNSFLHHVPDYISLVTAASALLTDRGQFFSFQDPLRYDSMGWLPRSFSLSAYLFWRIGRGDIMGGLKRRLRRTRGIYLDDCVADYAEYHVTRNGVDQGAIVRLLESTGFDCEVVRYFSTQNGLFQRLGQAIGIQNTFAVIGRKRRWVPPTPC